jgi:hypothetical protein
VERLAEKAVLARLRTLQTFVARLGAIIWIWTSPVEATVKRAVIAYPDVLPALKSQINGYGRW